MSYTPPQGPSLFSTSKRIARRWRPASLVFAAFFVLIASGTFLMPNKYEAKLKILVKNERIDPLLSADKQAQGILYLDEVSEARINTEIELLTSRDILRQIVSKCHLAEISGREQHSTAMREEIALRQLQKDLVVTPVRKSNVIEVKYDSKNAQSSAEVLRTLSELYLSAHLKLHGATGSYQFFQDLSSAYAGHLVQAEADLASFRHEHSIVALPEEKALALQRAAELEKQYAESSAATRKSAQEAAILSRSLRGISATVEKERRSMPNQYATEQMSTILVGLQNKRAQTVLRYPATDRIVKELDSQIELTQDALAAARKSSAQEIATGPNPTFEGLQSQLIQARAGYAGNQARTAQLEDQLRTNRTYLLKLDAQTAPYEDRVRKVKELEELNSAYKKQADDARVAQMLDTQRISNVAIAEQPVAPAIPSSPKRGLILSLGFVWSLLLGVGTAVGLDFVSERVHSPFELEQAIGVPLLATVPAGAIAPSYGGSFPMLYLSMQRTSDKKSESVL